MPECAHMNRSPMTHSPLVRRFLAALPFKFALAAWLLAALCFGAGLPSAYAAPATAATASATAAEEEVDLQTLRTQLDKAQAALTKPQTDEQMETLRDVAQRSVDNGQAAAEEMTPKLAEAKARLTELGAPPTTGKEAPEIARLRKESQDEVTSLDAKVKLANLLAVEGQQTLDQIRSARRSTFQSELGSRTASILSDRFWRDLRNGAQDDMRRTEHLFENAWGVARAIPTWALLGAAVLASLVVLLRVWLGKLLAKLLSTRVPSGRLRRSMFALLHVALATLTPLMFIEVVALGLSWMAPEEHPQGLLRAFSGPLCFGGFVAGLGNALLSAGRPSWRLLPLPDNVANGLRYFPLVMAVVMVVGWIADQFYGLLDTSLATTVAVHCILALSMGVVLVLAVMRGRRLQAANVETASEASDARQAPRWLQLAAVGAWLVLLGCIASLLLGYVAFGSYMLRQIIWSTLVLATAYLLMVVVVDVCETWQGQAPAPEGEPNADVTPQTATRLRQQVAVWVSGLLRVAILAVAVLVVVAPVGEGPMELFERSNTLGQGLTIGQVNLRPALVVQALLVLLVCLGLLRLLRRWLRDSLLPTTQMDNGMRTSVLTLVNYVGMVLAVAMTLSAVGISLEGIAWVASALSVGIGFGLQAVVQNFVSGLILLAERPVKVGDWVTLDTVEGDIRRINVRATEIQLGDRSTVIVPNSELITKIVRNVTMANPLGRVQVLLPMPLDTDAAHVSRLLMEAMMEHPAVLKTPEPSVALEGLDVQGRLKFTATCYVSSPRNTYNTRSELWFTVLEQLRLARLPLHATQRMQFSAVSGEGAVPSLLEQTSNGEDGADSANTANSSVASPTHSAQPQPEPKERTQDIHKQ
jgi:potassium efflux system protein